MPTRPPRLAKLGFRAAHAACPAFVFARAFLPTPMTWLLMSGREPGFIAGDAAPASKQQCGYLWSATHRDALVGRHQRRPSTVLGCVGAPASCLRCPAEIAPGGGVPRLGRRVSQEGGARVILEASHDAGSPTQPKTVDGRRW